MKTKLVTLLCVMALLASVLSGCGGAAGTGSVAGSEVASQNVSEVADQENADPETAADVQTAPEEDSAVEAQDAEEIAEAPEGNPFGVVFPGMDTAELSFSNVYELPIGDGDSITVMHESLNLMGPLAEAGAGIESFQQMGYIQEIQARTGITLEITELNHSTKDEQVQLAIASGALPDVLCGMSYATGDEGALADDVIVDLTDYAEYAPNYFYMVQSAGDQKKQFLSDGKVLKFMSPYEQYRANQGMVIRKDWLEEQGMEVPETYDQMTEVLKAFKDAYNCSSPIYMTSQCYITGLSDGYDITAFPADGSVESVMPYYVDNGVVKSTLNSDGFKDYLAMLRSWYEDGLFDPDFVSVEYNPFSDYLSGHIDSDQMGVWVTSGEGIDNYSVPIACVPMLVRNEGDMDHIFPTSLTTDSMNDTYVTTNCENIELVMNYLDYWYSQDGILFFNYGVEGESYYLNDSGEPEFTDALINNEYGLSVSNMMRLYCGYGIWSAPMLRMRTAAFNSDLADEAWEVWSAKLDGAMTMPDYISLNTDQAETEGYHSSDILTYTLQMVPQFIIGASDLDAEWDTYCSKLEDMGLNECVEVWQEAYDKVMQ